MISDAKNRIPGYTVGNSQIATMFSCKVMFVCFLFCKKSTLSVWDIKVKEDFITGIDNLFIKLKQLLFKFTINFITYHNPLRNYLNTIIYEKNLREFMLVFEKKNITKGSNWKILVFSVKLTDTL